MAEFGNPSQPVQRTPGPLKPPDHHLQLLHAAFIAYNNHMLLSIYSCDVATLKICDSTQHGPGSFHRDKWKPVSPDPPQPLRRRGGLGFDKDPLEGLHRLHKDGTLVDNVEEPAWVEVQDVEGSEEGFSGTCKSQVLGRGFLIIIWLIFVYLFSSFVILTG